VLSKPVLALAVVPAEALLPMLALLAALELLDDNPCKN
jgi:hypothetical protein